jgi:malonyl-CoA O-methyltransferase
MTAMSAREAYARWASTYETETAISFLENLLVAKMPAPSTGGRKLDVGCGTGRRLQGNRAVGVDASIEMLRRSPSDAMVAAADARALPFADASFDVVWCRLMIGHLPALAPAYGELARVVRVGGAVVVSDLAADAARAGHRRTFRDSDGVVREVEHFVHDHRAHGAAAQVAQLEVIAHRFGVVGPEIRHFYENVGRLAWYEAQIGLPLVSAISFIKTSA